MPEVDILLAAYNGEEFIAEQIDSILAQTFQDFRLLVRDDGSTDNTQAIIDEYARKYPDKIVVIQNDGNIRKGPSSNFTALLKHSNAEYVMFCDQDDYWLPYKVQVSLWHIKDAERRNPGKPVYVFSGLNVVDEKLKEMEIFLVMSPHSAEYKRFTNLLLSNIVAGCTSIINKALYMNFRDRIDSTKYSHDVFFALMASMCGVIEHIPAAMILYRQHQHNTSGYMGTGKKRSYWRNILLKISRTRFSDYLRRSCEFLRSNYADVIPPEKLEELKRFEDFVHRNRMVKFFMLLFGKGYRLDGNLYCRMKYFLRLVVC